MLQSRSREARRFVEPAALLVQVRPVAPVLVQLGQPLRLAGDALGLSAQAVGELIGAIDALLVGGIEGPARGELREERGELRPRGCPVEPGGLDEPPALLAPRARGQQGLFGRHVVLELEGLQLGLSLPDQLVFGGQPLDQVLAMARGFLEPGLVLLEGGVQGHGQGDELFIRSVPARELRQGGRRRLRRAGELALSLGEPRIEVAGLASLADRAAEPFDIAGDLQLGQLLLLPVDLGVMPDDRLLRLLGLPAQLGELLPQPADDHRLIGAEPQRLGLVQVGRSAQLAEDPPRMVLAVVLEAPRFARGPPPPCPPRPAAP